MTVQEWREAIQAGWDKWGTGKPLDPRTVEHLAQEFAKPLMPDPVLIRTGEWPWDRYGMSYNHTMFAHRSVFMPNSVGATHAWWDGSCLVTALAKEGPKAIVKWEPR